MIALYNPASKARPHQLGEAFALLRTVKAGDTPVLFVRAAGSAEARVIATTLAEADASAGRHAHAGHRRRAARRAHGSAAGSTRRAEPGREARRRRPCRRPVMTMRGRLVRPRDHDDRQAERARRLDLGVGRGAAGVLRDQHVDPLVAAAGALRPRDRTVRAPAAGGDRAAASICVGPLDQPREIVMLRRCREDMQVWRPRLRKTRRGSSPSASAAASASATICQRSPASRRHSGRTSDGQRHAGLARRRRQHAPTSGRRRDAWHRRRPRSPRRAGSRARPSMPPKPPMRVGIGCGCGFVVRPASDSDRREPRVAGELSRERRGFRRAAEDQDAQGHGRE